MTVGFGPSTLPFVFLGHKQIRDGARDIVDFADKKI